MLKENQPRKEQRQANYKARDIRRIRLTSNGGSSAINNIRNACKKFQKLDFKSYKTSMDRTISESFTRCDLIRTVIGCKVLLMVDANQFWDAMSSVKGCKTTKPYYIEEPTSPDDVLGHLDILKELRNIKLLPDEAYTVRMTCGETCANRMMFKQFLKIGGIDFWNINVERLGGVNEALAVYFMAKKHNSKSAISDNYIFVGS